MGQGHDFQLVPFQRGDIGELRSWISSREALVEWAGALYEWPLQEAQMSAHYEGARGTSSVCSPYKYVSAADGSMVGYVELNRIDRQNRCAALSRVIVKPTLRGTGLSGPMLRAVLDIGFSELSLHRVELCVYAHNEAALRAYQSLGFVVEGRLREVTRVGERYWDEVRMSLLDREWPGFAGSSPSTHLHEALQVLGIAADATPDVARRAYLRLIKYHKPERDPEGFRRIREAYETASQLLACRGLDAFEELLDSASEGAEGSSLHATGQTELAAFEHAVAEATPPPTPETSEEPAPAESGASELPALVVGALVQEGRLVDAATAAVSALRRNKEMSVPLYVSLPLILALEARGHQSEAKELYDAVKTTAALIDDDRRTFGGMQLEWLILQQYFLVRPGVEKHVRVMVGRALEDFDWDEAPERVKQWSQGSLVPWFARLSALRDLGGAEDLRVVLFPSSRWFFSEGMGAFVTVVVIVMGAGVLVRDPESKPRAWQVQDVSETRVEGAAPPLHGPSLPAERMNLDAALAAGDCAAVDAVLRCWEALPQAAQCNQTLTELRPKIRAACPELRSFSH